MKQHLGSLAGIGKSKAGTHALNVVRRLNNHGYRSYLVGGCIRDSLLGKEPKDFDVATAAHPHEVRSLFRNSRLIGRRFRIVHVYFDREVIEVTTFRGPHNNKHDENHSQSGMILSDNIYGTFDEDVLRRDFTMNAIYYDAATRAVVDLTHGQSDIQRHLIRCIGTPEKRFREDPVRMLRAIRFEAKLGFQIEESSVNAIHKLGALIQNTSSARLYDETFKLFMSGYGLASLEALTKHDFCRWLFPETNWSAQDDTAVQLARLALKHADTRIKNRLSVSPGFIYAALLHRPFVTERNRLKTASRLPTGESYAKAARAAIFKQRSITVIPKHIAYTMKGIWNLQNLLSARGGHVQVSYKLDATLKNKLFRAAYDFLRLREQAGEETDNLGDWWAQYQRANAEQKTEMERLLKERERKSP